MQIPIENIYFLLCYAWNTLDEKDRVAVSIDDRTSLLDLFARVLINSTRLLVKRGIDRNYVAHTAEYLGIKGKLELDGTLKASLHLRNRTICSFDEFSADIESNRLLATTMLYLLKIPQLDKRLKLDIRGLLPRFAEVTPIFPLKPSAFSQIRLHRNNRFYGFVLKVCRLIVENLRPAETPGEWKFADFTRDENKMNRLFEKFVLNFYSIETNFKVRSEIIKWSLTTRDEASARWLPQMLTDVTLESPRQKFIIDCKFYQETMAVNYSQAKVRSTHLYQIFSYLLNQRSESPLSETAKGILLYPTINDEYSLDFAYEGHAISIKTVNLNDRWTAIDERLKEIVGLTNPVRSRL